MVGYVTYAETFGWTPQEVDRLTIAQDDWLIPIMNAVNGERAYKEKKAAEAQERKAKAQRNRGFL
jgi:hypothetical protein